MAEVRLTPRARADLFDIWAHIAADSTRAADGIIRRIMKKLQLAAEHPHMGATRSELGSDVRILVEDLHVIIYEPELDGILVIAVVHGMRDPSSWL